MEDTNKDGSNKVSCGNLRQNMRMSIRPAIILIIFVFVVISVLCLCQKTKNAKPMVHSSQLQKVTVKDISAERTDYYNADGDITIAADLGYASSVITETEDGKIEKYYDDQGEMVRRRLGYYAVLRKYDDLGNNVYTIYLDEKGSPVVMGNGYAIEERSYNEEGQVASIRYYDENGLPVPIMSTAYGKKNEYDENGNVSRIVYVDMNGVPVMTQQGYAIIMRNNGISDGTENGKTEEDFYFDEDENPVSLSLGEYGVHKEYDKYGRVIVLTYLNALGEKILTNKGYTTIVRSYHADNSVATEQYYDIDGTPFPLSEGQYGIKRDGNQTVYLDQNGNESFNLRNLLYNHSGVIIVAAITAVILAGMTGRKVNAVFLLIYICIIVYFTLMFRESDNKRAIGVFLSYGKIFTDSKAGADILKNIWLFVPLGAIVYRLYPKKVTLLFPVVLSILIEGFQYFSGLGFCEIDDVVSNGIGGCIGYAAGILTDRIKQRINIWKQK